jgi:hypothetical protein
MTKKLFIYCALLLLNLSSVATYPMGLGPDKFSKFNGNKNNICYLNYNNVYSCFYDWSKNSNLEYKQKILDDTIWLNKNRFISSTTLVGIYNSDDVNNLLNYVCLLRKTSYNTYKILNIFPNPDNKINDDDILFNYLLLFCKENDASIDFENLKTIENSKYYLTYIYKYLF